MTIIESNDPNLTGLTLLALLQNNFFTCKFSHFFCAKWFLVMDIFSRDLSDYDKSLWRTTNFKGIFSGLAKVIAFYKKALKNAAKTGL